MSSRDRATTVPDFVSCNGQTVLRKTGSPGNDHNQVVYVLRCGSALTNTVRMAPTSGCVAAPHAAAETGP